MKKNLYFAVCILVFLTLSCGTFSPSSKNKGLKDYTEKKLIQSLDDDYLIQRVWRLAGCYLENGQYILLDANMTGSRINFLKNGRFEAASGITNYTGTWTKTKNKAASSFRFHITEKQLTDPSNIIGKPFDSAFEQNLINTDRIEITENEIKFYSKEELLLHFIRF